jgi:hypothetical protein
LLFRGNQAIKSSAVDRILKRVEAFADKEQWAQAEALLDKLLIAKPWDRSVLLTKAHLYKQMWLTGDRKDHKPMEKAISLFSRCHLLTGSAEAGINTATLLLLSGREDDARRKASEVARHCRNQILEGEHAMDGFLAGVIAEANLVNGMLDAAEGWYETARTQDSTVVIRFRENMLLILEHTLPDKPSADRLREALRA